MPPPTDARGVEPVLVGYRFTKGSRRVTRAMGTWLAWLAACASPPAAPRAPHPRIESALLGPFPRGGCFHVAVAARDNYRFVVDDVVYPRALGAGHVAVIVHAVDIGDLEPRPIELPRLPRLEFSAKGEASGAFELTLLLVDGEGRESQPTRLDTICANPIGGP